MTGMSTLLEINGLKFSYGRQSLFEDFSLSLKDNQVIGLLGLNGQGKSTLLKLLAGVLPVSPATTRKVMSTDSRQPLSIGYMPERPLFFPELTARDNVVFAAGLQGLAGDNISRMVDDSIRRCRLEDRQHQLAGHLSKGYQQRLGLAMAIVHRPRLLLLDEPIDGMDPGQVRETHALISELSSAATILISSHRVFEINELCQRVLFLHEGKIRHDLSLGDSQSRENLADLFEKVTSNGLQGETA
jgi:ABC-2 type transport system ATP-binding protein